MSRIDFEKHFEYLKKINNELKRILYFCALLTEALKPKGIRPIVVGGQALEFYTLGNYSTLDVDLVSTGYREIGEILEEWGFEKFGRHWNHDELRIAIEIPSEVLSGSYDRLLEVEIDNFSVYIIGVEDLIVDRLNSYVHWHIKDDKYWVRTMMALYFDKIDWAYLEKASKRELTYEAFIEIKRDAEKDLEQCDE